MPGPAAAASAQQPPPGRDRFGDPLPPGAVARFGTVKLRHGADIRGVQFQPDGKRLIAWGWDGVRVWDVATGAEVRHVPPWPAGAQWRMRNAVLSPDGRTF